MDQVTIVRIVNLSRLIVISCRVTNPLDFVFAFKLKQGCVPYKSNLLLTHRSAYIYSSQVTLDCLVVRRGKMPRTSWAFLCMERLCSTSIHK